VSVAVTELRNQGLPKPTITEVFDETVKAGIVKEQTPREGESVLASAAVELVVSKGPERVGVPKVVGITRTKALLALKVARLVASDPLTEQFDEKIPAGNVIAIKPVADEKVKPGTPVTLTVSKGREPITVPKVAGQSFDIAAKTLTGAGLGVGRKNSFSEKTKLGTVVSQTPASGTLFRGGTVTLTVSKGPAPVPMPNVIGMERKAAVSKLNGIGLQVKLVDFPGLKGKTVARQFPDEGTLVAKGKTVVLYLF